MSQDSNRMLTSAVGLPWQEVSCCLYVKNEEQNSNKPKVVSQWLKALKKVNKLEP